MKLNQLNVFLMDERGLEYLVATKVYVATRIEDRKQGLIGMASLPEYHAMLIYPSNAIHMRGVKFPIDVVYLDKSMHVVKLVKHLMPGDTDAGHPNAYFVLELPADTIHFNPVRMRMVVHI